MGVAPPLGRRPRPAAGPAGAEALRSRWRRPPAWTLLGALTALAIAGPLVALPASFLIGEEWINPIALTLLPGAVARSVLLGVGVGAGTLVLGGGLALLVSFYDFPGRRWLEWALVLPLAMPGYVLVFVLVGQYGYANPLQSTLFGSGLQLPGLNGPAGAIGVLTAVLYPYVYVLGRSAFLGQSRESLEAARSLGRSYGQAVRRVALPLARPALAAGTALTVMEALADFGAVNLLGYRALTAAIYRVWYGAFNLAAALQLATVLVALALLMLVLERLLRGRARYHQALARGDTVSPRRLRGWRAGLAAAIPSLVLAVVFVIPILQLVAWSVETVVADRLATGLADAAITTLVLGVGAAALALVTSTVIVYGQRVQPSRIGAASARLASVGYAVPGTVIAVAIYVPLVWLDQQLIDAVEGLFGVDLGLLFTGTLLGLVAAYVVRFHAQAYFALDTRMGRISPNLDNAARVLGAGRTGVLRRVHLPLLWPGLVTAALLVMVEVMKELPATALLRPVGGDTLAIMVWTATKASRFEDAALPALLIVLAGLIPVIVLVRLWGGPGSPSATERTVTEPGAR